MSHVLTIGAPPLALTLRVPETGQPEILSFGETSPSGDGLADIDRASRINGMDTAVPAAVLLPLGGMGFFGFPAIAGHRNGRDFVLQFAQWQVIAAGIETSLIGEDPVAAIRLVIRIGSHSCGALAMSTELTNLGAGDYMLDRCMAASFLCPGGEADVVSFTGMWGREFQTRREALGDNLWSRESRRGRTSHDRVPMVRLEAAGQTFAATLGWSGNHQTVIDRLDDGRRLLHLGELFEPGEMILRPGETYHSPVAYAASDSATLHALLREDLLSWPGGAMRPRPVTLNTWEGNYFHHDMGSLMTQATAAAAIGIERFVLDDGWFGERDDDTTSLGDWDIDPRKYPDGLKPLVDHVTGLGMEFGIWFEPEMVNPASNLFEAHPDWALQIDGRPLLLSRNQLVLDLTRPEVSDYLFAKLDAILRDHAIAAIKWDMNRDLTHVAGRDGRARASAQTRAVYALIDRIKAAHPTVEIESCASGGGRIDYGVLARTHRVWTSDCTDALERLEIQRGASRFLPPEILGSHVSASPNHQTGRRHSLAFRSLVAMAYHMGVELNPLELAPDERAELASYIETYKRLRPVLHARGANFHLEPRDGRYVWGAASGDKIVAFIAQGPQMVREQPEPLRLPAHFFAPGGIWRVTLTQPVDPDFIRVSEGQRRLLAGEIPFDLSELSSTGLPLPMLRPQSAILLEFEPVTMKDRHHG